jgi:hypothetical protein
LVTVTRRDFLLQGLDKVPRVSFLDPAEVRGFFDIC